MTLIALLMAVIMLFSFSGCSSDPVVNKVENNIITNTVVISNETEPNEVIITEEVEKLTEEIIEQTIINEEDVSTTEIIDSSIEEEEEIVDEGALENDASVEYENVSFDGDVSGNGLNLLGAYQGLTYYSQADSRWASVMYSSVNNHSQTMKSSACGPTSAAMVVSSSKGAILPTTMAELAVANRFRTADNGTAWSYFPFVADYFGFNEYTTTSYLNTALNYLSQKNPDGSSKYFAVVSCTSGLFTTSGHYVVIASVDGNTISVFDPYLYNGKFNTASRRAAGVTVSGNTAYVSVDAFRNYGGYKGFFIYSNDMGQGNPNSVVNPSEGGYVAKVTTSGSTLNVRASAGGSVISSLANGTQVTVVEEQNGWSRITNPVKGWVSSSYLQRVAKVSRFHAGEYVEVTVPVGVCCFSGDNALVDDGNAQYWIHKSLLDNGNIHARVLVVFAQEDNYIVEVFGTQFWVKESRMKSLVSTPVQTVVSTVGKVVTFKNRTDFYASSSMKGTTYTYKAGTQVKILKNVNSSIDYIQVLSTGRKGYAYKTSYK